MKEKRKKEQVEKDYYSAVLFSQILCSVFILILFFCVNTSSKKQELKNAYSFLLCEDFLTEKISDVFSSAGDYLAGRGASFAVSGNKVTPYTPGDILTTSEAKQEATEKPVFLPEKVSEVSLSCNHESAGLYDAKETEGFAFPVSGGSFTSLYGKREDPINGGDDFHKGVDIGADTGDGIMALSDGIVSCVGEDSVAGKYIFVTHSERYETFYCHCSDILAKEGTLVRKGDTIALVGSTGYSTGPHLHFEVRLDGKCIDPMPFLKNAV